MGHWDAEPRDWDIYRGDSFTLMMDGHAALLISLVLQATLLAEAELHVRIGIGIGEVSWRSDRITESQGEWAEALGKSQSTTSAALKRAHFDEIKSMVRRFSTRISNPS